MLRWKLTIRCFRYNFNSTIGNYFTASLHLVENWRMKNPFFVDKNFDIECIQKFFNSEVFIISKIINLSRSDRSWWFLSINLSIIFVIDEFDFEKKYDRATFFDKFQCEFFLFWMIKFWNITILIFFSKSRKKKEIIFNY